MKTLRFAITALLLVAASGSFAQDKTMLQGFYWDVTPGGVWWDNLGAKAPELGAAGFDILWIPPFYKGASGTGDVGYTPYDYYDLGNYNSKGGDNFNDGNVTDTRYGNKTELKNMINAYHASTMQVWGDMVLNHRSGGNLEANPYTNSNTWTSFPITKGSKRVAWSANGYNFFYPNASVNPGNTGDYYSEDQLGARMKMYTNWFAYDNALHNGSGNNLPYGDSLMVWGDWVTKEIGLDGYRFDFVKGIHPEYMKRWLNYGAMRGKPSVGEHWDSAPAAKEWLRQTSSGVSFFGAGGPVDAAPGAFDFELRYRYQDLSNGGDAYDGRNAFQNAGLHRTFGVPYEKIWSFIENHDFDRKNYQGLVTIDGHNPIVNKKNLLYAHMLTLPTNAQIWYHDVYTYGMKDELFKLVSIKHKFAKGSYSILTLDGSPVWTDSNDDPKQMYIAQRSGNGGQTGLIVAVNKHSNRNITTWVTTQWASKQLKDITGRHANIITVQSDGRAGINCNANSYAIWVPTDYSLTPSAPAVAISPVGGSISGPTTITIATTGGVAPVTTYYTLDGSDPKTSGTRVVYSAPFSVSTTKTVKAIAVGSDSQWSPAVSQTYTLVTTSFTVRFKKPAGWGTTVNVHYWNRLPGGTASTWPGVAMTAEANSWYAYTFTGTTSTNLLFVDPVTQTNKTVDLTQSANGWYKDGVWYTSNPDNTAPVLTVNPASQSSATAITVTMSATDADGDAVSIYYTQNGTTPTAASTKYTAAFSVTSTKTIKAIAIDARGAASAVAQRDYTIGTVPGLTVHFWKPASWSSTVKVHYWNTVPTTAGSSTWPGVNAVAEGDGWFKYTIAGATSSSVIFSDNGSTTVKTADLSRTGEGWYINGTWYSAKPSVLKIHYRNMTNWAAPTIYFWNTGSGQTSTWPGKAMENEGAGWFCYPIVGTTSASIIFSNNGASQTANLSRTGEGWYKSGVWYSTKPAGKDEASENDGIVSNEFTLFQNYPNPFNPSTTIGFNLPSDGLVTLKVYDVLGKEIATLINESISSGNHVVSFDAAQFPSGVYFYRLTSEGRTEIRKMTLMK